MNISHEQNIDRLMLIAAIIFWWGKVHMRQLATPSSQIWAHLVLSKFLVKQLNFDFGLIC